MKELEIEKGQSQDPAPYRVKELETLSAVASAVSGVVELGQVLARALDTVMKLSTADKGAIHLLDANGQELVLRTHRGLSSEYSRAHHKLKVGEDVVGRTVQTGQAVVVEDSTTDAQTTHEVVDTDEYRSLICVPLRTNAGVLGTIAMLSAQPRHFSPLDVPLLSAVAHQIAAAIETARLFEEKERRVKELAALNEIGQAIGSTLNLTQVLKLVARKTAAICNAERCSILLLDQQKNELMPMMSQFASGAPDTELWRIFKEETLAEKVADVPVMGEVIKEGRTVVLDEESRSRLPERWTEPFGIKSLLLVPLASRDETIGLLALDYTTEGQHFTTEQMDLATTIGSQVAIAVENARLYAREKKRAAQLSVINEVGRRATSSLNLDELLQETAVAIQEGFNYHFVSILMVNEEAGEAEQRAEVGRHRCMRAAGYRLSLDEGLIGWVVRNAEPLVVNNVAQDARYLEGFPTRPFTKAELVVPIKQDRTVAAVLDIQSAELNAFDATDLMSMQAIADQLSVAMENAQLYEDITEHSIDLEATNREIVALQDISASLAGTLDLQEVLQKVVDGVVGGLGYSLAGLAMIDEQKKVVGNLVFSGIGNELVRQVKRMANLKRAEAYLPLDAQENLAVQSLKAPKTLMTDSLYQVFRPVIGHRASNAIQELLSIKTIIGVPLLVEGRPVGGILASTRKTEQNEQDLAPLQAFANQAALAIQRARLYEETKKRLDELSTLHETALAATSTVDLTEILDRIIGALKRTLGFTNLTVMLVDDADQRLKITAGAGYPPEIVERMQPKLGQGITGWVAQKGEPLNVPDVAADPRYIIGDEKIQSELCVPLKAGERTIGVLNVESTQGAAFSEDDVRFLSILAGQLAVIIENARLFQQVVQGQKEWEDTFEAITDGIAIYDAELTLLRANPALAKLLDTTPEALVGKHCCEVLSHCEGPGTASCLHRRTMETRGPTSVEVEEPRLNRTLHVFSFPIFDEVGDFKGTVHTIRDATEEKLLRAQLLQTEKLAAIGRLVSGVAHELNNPLTSVMGYAQLLQTADVSQEIKDDLRSIYQEAQRSAKIIENLLTFARKEKTEKRYTNINQALSDTLELRAYQLKVDNIELIRQLDEHLPSTMAAPHQLQQVFLNLINNAHQAMLDHQGEKRLIVRSETDDEVIRVKVTDNGPGIAEDTLRNIFDPFFTTKEVGQGTGLGLSIAFGIVQEHGGQIWAESEVAKGTTFTVELPIVQRPSDSLEVAGHPGSTEVLSGKRILVIDDEEGILQVIRRMLEGMGHQVVTLPNAETALDKMDSEEYDLVICDVRMPGIGGQELFQLVKKRKPELAKRIIFTTGDTVSDSTRVFLENTTTPHLSKPFKIEDLEQVIEEVLQRQQKAIG